MDGRIRWLLAELDDWRRDGIVDAPTAQGIEARYEGRSDEPSLAIRTFYFLGGVLLAAAVFALFAFMELRGFISSEGWAPWLMFLGFGALWLGTGAAVRPHNVELSDALLVAGIVQTAALIGPDPGPNILFFAAPLIAAGVLAYRHRDTVLPAAALLALSITLPTAWERTDIGDDDIQVGLWLASAVLVLIGTLFWTRTQDLPWRIPGSAITGAAVAVGWTVFTGETLTSSTHFDGDMELFVALGLGALLGIGLWLQDRALVYVGGLGLTADAIVFAFDVGGVEWGLATLIVFSIGLLVVATWLRQRKAAA